MKAALPTPIYLALGRRYRVAYVVNLFFMALMFGAVFGTARMYAGPRAGFLAVTTLGAIPVVYGLSHWYQAECPGVTMRGWAAAKRPRNRPPKSLAVRAEHQFSHVWARKTASLR